MLNYIAKTLGSIILLFLSIIQNMRVSSFSQIRHEARGRVPSLREWMSLNGLTDFKKKLTHWGAHWGVEVWLSFLKPTIESPLVTLNPSNVTEILLLSFDFSTANSLQVIMYCGVFWIYYHQAIFFYIYDFIIFYITF